MKSCVNEALGALRQEKESWAKNQEAYEGQASRMRKEVDKSRMQTRKMVYGTFDQVEVLHPNISIRRL